jgi:peptidoglycan/LPS O-acetylase OafA/YrhL
LPVSKDLPRAQRPLKDFFALHLLANQFPALHGLRALAVVSVLQIHITVSLHAIGLVTDPALHQRSISVWFGMDLFFFLSGFLIGTILIPSHEGTRGGIGRFYVRRMFRIVPPYYVVLTLLAVMVPASAEQLAGLPFEYAYLHNYHLFPVSPLMPWAWSLCVEEHFYLAVPLVAALLTALPRPSWRIGALVMLWLAGLGVRYAIFASRPSWTPAEMFADIYFRTHARFDILVAGLLLAYVQRAYAHSMRKALEPRLRQLALATVPAFCAWALLGPLALRHDLSTIFAWGTVTSVMYFTLVLLVINTDSPVTRWLSSRWFLRFATLGYGVYLVHPVVIGGVVAPAAFALAYRFHLPLLLVWWASLAMLLVLASAAAYVLHILVEKPALYIRDRVAR